MKTKFITGISLLVLSFCLLPFQYAQAEEVAPEEQTIITHLQDTDTTLTAEKPAVETTLEVYDYWSIDQALVNVDYRLSQLSLTGKSNLTLSVNGVKFYSMALEQKDGKQHVHLVIPKEFLKVGKNTLKVETHVTTNVSNVQTPADWLFVYQSSNVGVIYQNKDNHAAIRSFHDRFSGEDNITDKEVAILVPDNTSGKELQAATMILSGYKKIGKRNTEIIPINQLSSANDRKKNYLIIVAMYNRLPAEYQKQIDEKTIVNDALLKVFTTQQQQVLVVTSKNKEALLTAGKFIANSELMKQVEEPEKVISEKMDVDTLHIPAEQAIQFTETGDQLQGEGYQSRDYFVPLPSNRSIAYNSQIHLEYRHSENLDFEHSLVTVLINGIPIGSKKLSLEKASGDELTLKVPNDIDVSGDFNVTVSFDLEMKNQKESTGDSQAPWAFITDKSIMALLTNDRTDLLFETYPFPFLKDGTYNQVGVVLPKKMNDYYYRALSNVFNLLGTYTQDNTGEITYITDGEKSSPAFLKASNLIVIGSYQDNTLLPELNKELYFNYNDQGTGFLSNEKMPIESGYGKRIGSAQLISSPYEDSKGILAITGAQPESIYLASKELATWQSVSSHSGDAFIVDKSHQVENFHFKKSDKGLKQNVTETVKKKTSLITYVGLFLFAIAAVGVLLVFAINKRRKNQGGK